MLPKRPHFRRLRSSPSTLRATGAPPSWRIRTNGALAALLVDLGFPPELGNAFFIVARVTGLAAHVNEEMTGQRPMRRIHPTDHAYDGPVPQESK